jgi:hypothetical protein
MEARIPAKSILLFSKMVTCLSKIGEDLFLEATDDKLVLRTLNQTRSAFFCFSLGQHFFEAYRLIEQGTIYRCKLVLKACSAVFKSTANVDKCIISVRKTDSSMKFELHCKLGVRKTYELDLEESDTLQAVYSKENCPNRMQVAAHIFSLCLNNFPVNLEEITLVLCKDYVRVKSYVDNQKTENVLKKLLLTELTLSTGDFESYEFTSNREVELTFCLKEMKAILQFCEKQTQPLAFFMEDEGKPILMSVSIPKTFEADFVLATLLDPTADQSQSQTASTHKSTATASNTNQNHSSPSTASSTASSNFTNTSTGTSMDVSQYSTSDSSPSNRKRPAQFNIPSNKQKMSKVQKEMDVDDDDGEDVILWGKDIQSNRGTADDNSQ